MDEQKTLPCECKEEVMENMKHAIRILGCHDRGFIGEAGIATDAPKANAEYVYKMIKKYGGYPKRID